MGRQQVQTKLIYFEMYQEYPRLTARGAWKKGRQVKIWGHHHTEIVKEATQGVRVTRRKKTAKEPQRFREIQDRRGRKRQRRHGQEPRGRRRGCSHRALTGAERSCSPEGPARGSPRPGATAERDGVLVDAGSAARPWACASSGDSRGHTAVSMHVGPQALLRRQLRGCVAVLPRGFLSLSPNRNCQKGQLHPLLTRK